MSNPLPVSKSVNSGLERLPPRLQAYSRFLGCCGLASRINVPVASQFETLEEFKVFRRSVYNTVEPKYRTTLFVLYQRVFHQLSIQIALRNYVDPYSKKSEKKEMTFDDSMACNNNVHELLVFTRGDSGKTMAELKSLALTIFIAHIKGAEILLEADPSRAIKSRYASKSAFDYAVLTGRVEFVTKLWNLGSRPTVNSLKDALSVGSDQIALFLLQNVDQDILAKWIPEIGLEDAVCTGNFELVQALMDSGVKPDVKKEDYPLHAALKSGFWKIAELLLDHGAKPDIKSKEEKTPLEIAVGHDSLEGVRILITKCRSIIENEDEEIDAAIFKAVEKGDLKTLELLFTQVCHLDIKNAENQGLIHVAAIHGHLEIYKFLISKGCHPLARDSDGRTTLHWACYKGHLSFVRHLIENKMDVDVLDKNRSTPLFYAIDSRNRDIIRYLKAHSADFIHQRTDGEDPVSYAIKKNDCETAGFVESLGGCLTLASNGRLLSLEHLTLDSHSNLVLLQRLFYSLTNHATYRQSWQKALNVVAKANNLEWVEKIVSKKIAATPLVIENILDWMSNEEDKLKILKLMRHDLETFNSYHLSTFFMMSLSRKLFNVARFFIQVTNDFKDNGNWVCAAVQFNHLEFVKELHALGAPLESPHEPTLPIALQNRNVPLASFLIENGVDVSPGFEQSKVCMHLMMQMGDFENYQLLIQKGVSPTSSVPFPLHAVAVESVEELESRGRVVIDPYRTKKQIKIDLRRTYESKFKIIKDLLARGCNINEEDQAQTTILQIFFKSGRDLADAKELIRLGADINLVKFEDVLPDLFKYNNKEKIDFIFPYLTEDNLDIDTVGSCFIYAVKSHDVELMNRAIQLYQISKTSLKENHFSYSINISVLNHLQNGFDKGFLKIASLLKVIKHVYSITAESSKIGNTTLQLSSADIHNDHIVDLLQESYKEFVLVNQKRLIETYPGFTAHDLSEAFSVKKPLDLDTIKSRLDKGLPIAAVSGYENHTIGTVWYVDPAKTKFNCILVDRGNEANFIGMREISAPLDLGTSFAACSVAWMFNLSEKTLVDREHRIIINNLVEFWDALRNRMFDVRNLKELIEQYGQKFGICRNDNVKGMAAGLFYSFGILCGKSEGEAAALAKSFYKEYTQFLRNRTLNWIIQVLKVYSKDFPLDGEVFHELYFKVRNDPRIDQNVVLFLGEMIEKLS